MDNDDRLIASSIAYLGGGTWRGRILVTEAVQTLVEVDCWNEAVGRHICGDWGDIPELLLRTNEATIRGEHGTLASQFVSHDDVPVMVVSDARREILVVALPREAAFFQIPKVLEVLVRCPPWRDFTDE